MVTSCGSPGSRPTRDRLTFSWFPPVTSSVPEPLTPEPLRPTSVVVKCCAPLLLGVGGVLGDGLAETHFPNALASCALTPYVEAKDEAPILARSAAQAFAAFFVVLMLTLRAAFVPAVMHEASAVPSKPRCLQLDVAATRAPWAFAAHCDRHAPYVWYALPSVFTPSEVRSEMHAWTPFVVSVPLIALPNVVGIASPATMTVTSVSLSRIRLPPEFAAPDHARPPRLYDF